MKIKAKQLLAASLACAALLGGAAAHASSTEWTSTYYVPADLSGPGFVWNFSFGDAFGAAANAFYTDAVAGDTFVDDFLFNTQPPTSLFSFFVSDDAGGSGIDFTSVALFDGDFVTQELGLNVTLGSGAAVAGFQVLDSGVYDLRISGTLLANGASFTGAAASALLVPEPTSIGLAFAALLGLAAAGRRRAAR